MVTDLNGNRPGRMDEEINGLLVSNSLVHEQLVELLKP